ncbi:MAG: DUF1761 domain-containing protein [Minisyncoccia bacterium]
MINILVGALAIFIFGMIWYTALFGKLWAKLSGISMEPDPNFKGMAKPMLLNFVANILPMISVYYMQPRLTAIGFESFWKLILVVWLGFTLPTYLNAAIWERKSWKLVLLNSAYTILLFTIAGAIAYYWPR